jgi:dTDP-4-amino-4,6-dideoxygalactose transaminase
VARHAKSAPPPDLLCYNFRATSFHPVILGEQLHTLDARLQRYSQAVRYLEERLSQSTKIRFQRPGKKAGRQGRFGWVMIFDDPAYADIPIDVIHKALQAERAPSFFRAEGPIYRFILFNLQPHEYRIHNACTVTEQACSRILWLLHAHLGLDGNDLEKIAGAIEKVMHNTDELRKYAARVGSDKAPNGEVSMDTILGRDSDS